MATAFDETVFGSQPGGEQAWEQFHENSKTGRHQGPLPNEAIVTRMHSLYETLPYPSRPRIPLPDRIPLTITLDEAIRTRRSALVFGSRQLHLAELSTVLDLAYGINSCGGPQRGRIRAPRNIPSAGALYPLELYLVAGNVSGIDPGLYHFDPSEMTLVYLDGAVNVKSIASSFLQGELVKDCSAMILITAIFERTVFKYSERSYRFSLIEAGHLGQNIDLVATAFGLAVLNIGGYFDREVDALLSIDGLSQSTIYACALGGR